MELLYLIVRNKEVYEEDFGIYITHEKNQGIISDEIIYYYVEDDFDLTKVKEGEKIQLDEEFEVIKTELIDVSKMFTEQ